VDVTLQVLVSGLAAGAIYGLVGVGHSLVYRLTGVVHFAFGELIALAVFATLFLAAGTAPVTSESVGGGRFLLAVVGGLAITAAASAGSYWFAVQPYQLRGSTIGWVGASLAVAFALRTLIVTVFDRPSYVLPDPLPFRDVGDEGFWHVGGATIQARSLFVIAVALALAAVSALVLTRTRFGARSRRSRPTSRARRSSACPCRASSGSRSRSPESSRGSRRSSRRRRAPSTSTPPHSSG
jgi:branched-chain amino acid transport system permease protein